jgi:hypothetical protein
MMPKQSHPSRSYGPVGFQVTLSQTIRERSVTYEYFGSFPATPVEKVVKA